MADCAAMRYKVLSVMLALVALCGCQTATDPDTTMSRPDPHSYAEPASVVVRHLSLDLAVDFEQQQLTGTATLSIDNLEGTDRLALDTRGLAIHRVRLDEGEATRFELREPEPYLGSELIIGISADTSKVVIDYTTSPDAAALQWLTPAQTASAQPFLFTQSQSILARSWVPCQDSPGIRMTYDATIKVPANLMAVMSAENATGKTENGVYRFSMPQPIPAYLLALAVGNLAFRSLGPRSGVYAEPQVIDRAAWEFAEVEAMIEAAESLYGPYRWGRYDLLVLPPSFPFGGMENPRLTFATPTILAGDRSLTALVAHELAHSWSGNLVTNATWNDFWLNEGFTVYFELRIMEAVKGSAYTEMLRALSLDDLRREVTRLGETNPDTHLYLALAGRDPDDAMTAIAYDKGAGLLRRLEEYVGRARWDAFLNEYFERHAFQSIHTAAFLDYLRDELLTGELANNAPDLDAWVYGVGIPADFPQPRSESFAAVESQLAAWLQDGPAEALETDDWTTHEWLHFIHRLPEGLGLEQLGELDRAFGLTTAGDAFPAAEQFLRRVGRRKFLEPLYTALSQNEAGLAFARRVYAGARPGYHSVSTGTIDKILDWPGK